MEFEEWELSAEQLDSLERDAFRQISQRNNPISSSSSSSSSTASTFAKPTILTPCSSLRNSQQSSAQHTFPSNSVSARSHTQVIFSHPHSDFCVVFPRFPEISISINVLNLLLINLKITLLSQIRLKVVYIGLSKLA